MKTRALWLAGIAIVVGLASSQVSCSLFGDDPPQRGHSGGDGMPDHGGGLPGEAGSVDRIAGTAGDARTGQDAGQKADAGKKADAGNKPDAGKKADAGAKPDAGKKADTGTGTGTGSWSDPYNFPSTRDPYKWPFAQNSIWNTPIGSTAQYVQYQSLSSNAQVGTVYLDDDIIVLTPNEPMLDVKLNTADWSWSLDRCTVDGGTIMSAPFPKSFLWHRPSTLSNACLAVLMPDGRTLKASQPFTRCDVNGPGLSHYNYPDTDIYGEGIDGSHGGSGMSVLGGAIRMGELVPGAPPIHHALKMAVQNHGGGHRWPAPKDDAGWGNVVTTGFCDGALAALPPSFNIASAGFETEVGKYIARACQDYGIYLVDGTGWSAVALMVENGANGWVQDEVQAKWGVSMDYASTSNTPFGRDMMRIFSHLMVVENNTANNRGGGGTPRAPLAPASFSSPSP